MKIESPNVIPEWYVGAQNYLVELEGKSKFQRERIDELNEKIYSPERGDYVLEKVKNQCF